MLNNYHKIEIKYTELEKLKLDKKSVFLSIDVNDVPFEFLINPNPTNNKAIIFGSGAYDPNKLSPPIFNRYSWKEDLNCTTIFYNDPTLYLNNVNLGWGYGTEDHHYLKTISDILQKLFEKLEIKTSDTLFYGSSGGGFTSIGLASMIKGAKALVNNPQTSITNYYSTFSGNLKEAAHQNRNAELEMSRSHLISIFKTQKNIPSIHYAQNIACNHDVQKHLLPFIKELNELDQTLIDHKIHLILYSNEKQGHTPMNKDETLNYINKIMSLN